MNNLTPPQTRQEAFENLRREWEVEIMARLKFMLPDSLRKLISDNIGLQFVFAFCVIVGYGFIHYFSKSGDQNLQNLQSAQWLGFWGSFCGGAFTMVAMWFTLNFQRNAIEKADQDRAKERKEDLELEKKRVESASIRNDRERLDVYERSCERLADLITTSCTYGRLTPILKELYALAKRSESKAVRSNIEDVCRSVSGLIMLNRDNPSEALKSTDIYVLNSSIKNIVYHVLTQSPDDPFNT